MRTYIVQPGDTPAKIAIEFAGCPKCTRDLVHANPHKETVTYPNGFTTFREIRVGETLNLPDKWFSKEFDELPPSYFAALPYADGVTPGKGRVGALGDRVALDDAAAQVNALASKDDRSFANSADGVAMLVDSSVQEVSEGTNPTASSVAETVRISTAHARKRNADLKAALDSGDAVSATRARLDVQNALATAVEAARIAFEVFYAPTWDVKIGQATVEPSAPPAPARTPARTPAPAPAPVAVAPPEQTGVSAGTVVGSLVGVSVVGGAIYWALKKKPARIRRVRNEEAKKHDRSTYRRR